MILNVNDKVRGASKAAIYVNQESDRSGYKEVRAIQASLSDPYNIDQFYAPQLRTGITQYRDASLSQSEEKHSKLNTASGQTVTLSLYFFLPLSLYIHIPRFLARLHFAVLQILGVAPRMKIIKKKIPNLTEHPRCF